MRASSKRIAPLVEMILVIFFFSLLSAITLQMFASAYSQSKRSQVLSVLTVEAQELAEQFKGGLPPEKASFTKVNNGGFYQIFYDKDLNRVQSGGEYMMELYYYTEAAAGGEHLTGRVTVYAQSNSENLFELKLGNYQPK